MSDHRLLAQTETPVGSTFRLRYHQETEETIVDVVDGDSQVVLARGGSIPMTQTYNEMIEPWVDEDGQPVYDAHEVPA